MFRIEARRGEVVESVHRVSLVLSDPAGRVLAWAGDPGLITYWRSAAKPVQAYPLVADGAADRFGFSDEALALACASHSSESRHAAIAGDMLARAGCTEADLVCGPHQPLSSLAAGPPLPPPDPFTPRWSNCSGKHAGMLALARHHGWPVLGYEQPDHPVQERVLQEVVRWTGTPRSHIGLGVDGCGVVSFALPVRAMALAYARMAGAGDPVYRRIVGAMMTAPHLVAGTGRLCTDLMAAFPGQLVAKIGAEGVYCAAFTEPRLGLALKVEDGDMRSCGVALLGALRALAGRFGLDRRLAEFPPSVARHDHPLIINTRGAATGELRSAGSLHFSD